MPGVAVHHWRNNCRFELSHKTRGPSAVAALTPRPPIISYISGTTHLPLYITDAIPSDSRTAMVGFMIAEPEEDRQSVHSVDRHSIASTVATTTSLASRIRDLNLFECGGAEDKDADEGKDVEHRAGVSTLPEDSEEEQAPSGAAVEDGRAGGTLSEEELSLPHSLHLLQRDPPLQVRLGGLGAPPQSLNACYTIAAEQHT